MNCRNLKNPSNYRFMHLLLIFLFSRKAEETLCDSWVLSTSVCGTGVSVPIPLRTQLAKAAQEVRGTSDLRGPEWNVEPRDAKLFY